MGIAIKGAAALKHLREGQAQEGRMALPATGSESTAVTRFSEPRKDEHGADNSYQNRRRLYFSGAARLQHDRPLG